MSNPADGLLQLTACSDGTSRCRLARDTAPRCVSVSARRRSGPGVAMVGTTLPVLVNPARRDQIAIDTGKLFS
jgi:hypothetical protein